MNEISNETGRRRISGYIYLLLILKIIIPYVFQNAEKWGSTFRFYKRWGVS
jgi:hypothetical protein